MSLALSGQKVACPSVWIDLSPGREGIAAEKSVLTLGGERKFQNSSPCT